LFQISRLEQTWIILRQRHTEGAILYEKKLKPFMKNMNDGKGEVLVVVLCFIEKDVWRGHRWTPTSPFLPESSVLSNTSFPHILPVLSLLERGVALGEALEPWESAEVGVDVVMYHLEAARTIAHHGEIYRTNADTKLQGKTIMLTQSALWAAYTVFTYHFCISTFTLYPAPLLLLQQSTFELFHQHQYPEIKKECLFLVVYSALWNISCCLCHAVNNVRSVSVSQHPRFDLLIFCVWLLC